jgi:NAD(P)-dependent dehydrogenase (short-subunit alcohol dehydrogenase family)
MSAQQSPSNSRIALITGANRGLGRSAALCLARDGVDIILTYRSHADEAAAVVAEIEALGRSAVALPAPIVRTQGTG